MTMHYTNRQPLPLPCLCCTLQHSEVTVVPLFRCLFTRVRQSYPDEARDINDREQEIMKMWSTLKVRADVLLFTTQCTLVQSAVLRSHVVHPSVCPSVRLSVTLVICDHIGWKSWKLIARTVSPTPSLFAAKG